LEGFWSRWRRPFCLTAYQLDEKVRDQAVTRIRVAADGKREEEPTTVGDILNLIPGVRGVIW
jgi:hypothetical protein